MDKNCYICQKDTLKKYICKECYFKIVTERDKLKSALEEIREGCYREVTTAQDVAHTALRICG